MPTHSPTEKPYRIRLKPGLNRRSWSEFLAGCGRKGNLKEQGIDSGWIGNGWIGGGKVSYFWDLGLKGELRYCSACGLDLAKGETMVRPGVLWSQDRAGTYTHEPKPALGVGFHTRCVTPEQWANWRGQPKSLGLNHFEKNPTRNEASFQAAIDEGWLKLEEGVTVTEAVDRVRYLAGQTKLPRR